MTDAALLAEAETRRAARAEEARTCAASGEGGLDNPNQAETPPNPREELRMAARMIRTWMPESFPANEFGQVHFVRAVIDSVAEAIERFFSTPSSVEQERIEVASFIDEAASRHEDTAKRISDEAGGIFGDPTPRDVEINMHRRDALLLREIAAMVRARTPAVEEPEEEPRF